MLFITILCSIYVCIQSSINVFSQDTQVTYPTRYDYLDIDQILLNDRILRRIMDCMMSRGPCTREGKELKRIIPDALRTNCSKCNERQKLNAGRALSYLLHYKPNYWFELLKKFDPDASFRKQFGVYFDDMELTEGERKTRSIDNDNMKLIMNTLNPMIPQIELFTESSNYDQSDKSIIMPT